MKTFIVFDNLDNDLGEYFSLCAEDIKEFFINLSLPFQEINNNRLNQVFIDVTLMEFIDIPFVFIAYSHGSENQLLSNGIFYLKENENLEPFKNSFLYSFACEAGQKLGKNIIEEYDGHGFFGYTNEASIYSTYSQIFSECANEGIKKLLGQFTLKDAYDSMVAKYNIHIDDIYSKNFFVASILMENRDGLVYYGNDHSTINEMFE